MLQKVLRHLPATFLVPLFRVKEVRWWWNKRAFRTIWTQVWIEEGYAYKEEPLSQIQAHYALFNEFSTDFLLSFLSIFPVGTMRFIRENSEIGLPVLTDFRIERNWEGRVAELTLLTLKKEWRGLKHIPPLILWKAGYQLAKQEGMVGIVMAADERLYHLLVRLFPFRQIGTEQFYEGSMTCPAFLDLQEAERIVAAKNPKLYKFFTS